MVLEDLKQVGLNEKEAKIYLSLLKKKFATASDISKSAGILRQTTYDILDSLKRRGLISTIKKGKKSYFIPTNPSILKQKHEEKTILINRIMPELEKVYKSVSHVPRVEVFEGIEGIKVIHEDLLKTKQPILEYGNASSYLELIALYFLENYVQKRRSLKIPLKLITEKSFYKFPTAVTNKKDLRRTKYHPLMEKIKIIKYIYKDKVAAISFEDNPIGVVIKDKEICNAERQFFEYLWQNSES